MSVMLDNSLPGNWLAMDEIRPSMALQSPSFGSYLSSKGNEASEECGPLVGLGMEFASAEEDLDALLSRIGDYERAVGRAYLHRRGLSRTGSSRSSVAIETARPISSPTIMTLTDLPEFTFEPVPQFTPTTSPSPVSEHTQSIWSSPSDMPTSTHRQSSVPEYHETASPLRAFNFPTAWPILEPENDSTHFDFFRGPGGLASQESLAHEVERTTSPVASCSSARTHSQFMPTFPPSSSYSPARTHDHTRISPSRSAHTSPRRHTNHARSMSEPFKGWSKEADDELRAQVRAQQESGIEPLQWSKIARIVGQRSGVQCQARWAEVLDERIRKGRWSSSEDDMLQRQYRLHGGQWSKIAAAIITRTQRQCRSRWLQMNGAASFERAGSPS